jgi:hypothetical protein
MECQNVRSPEKVRQVQCFALKRRPFFQRSVILTMFGLWDWITFFHIIWLSDDILKKKPSTHKICVLIFLAVFSETFFILRRIQWRIKNICLFCIINIKNSFKVSVILVNYNQTWIFSTGVRKIHKYQNFLKLFQWKTSCSLRKERSSEKHDEANSSNF